MLAGHFSLAEVKDLRLPSCTSLFMYQLDQICAEVSTSPHSSLAPVFPPAVSTPVPMPHTLALQTGPSSVRCHCVVKLTHFRVVVIGTRDICAIIVPFNQPLMMSHMLGGLGRTSPHQCRYAKGNQAKKVSLLYANRCR